MEDSLTPQASIYYSTAATSIIDEAPVDASLSMKSLFHVLLKNQIPGPRLIRLKSEFTTEIGHGGEGVVYAASKQFEANAKWFATNEKTRLNHSLHFWKTSVVKRLRSDDARPYAYADQVRIA